jgi:hypothetical protein
MTAVAKRRRSSGHDIGEMTVVARPPQLRRDIAIEGRGMNPDVERC